MKIWRGRATPIRTRNAVNGRDRAHGRLLTSCTPWTKPDVASSTSLINGAGLVWWKLRACWRGTTRARRSPGLMLTLAQQKAKRIIIQEQSEKEHSYNTSHRSKQHQESTAERSGDVGSSITWAVKLSRNTLPLITIHYHTQYNRLSIAKRPELHLTLSTISNTTSQEPNDASTCRRPMMISFLKLVISVLALLAACVLFPQFSLGVLRIVLRGVGWLIRKRTQARREAILARVRADEEKLSKQSKTASGSTPAEDEDWEKVDPSSSGDSSGPASQNSQSGTEEWAGIIGFFHPFW